MATAREVYRFHPNADEIGEVLSKRVTGTLLHEEAIAELGPSITYDRAWLPE